MATLRFRRTANRFPDWFRKYALLVDGEQVGKVGRAGEVEVGVAPGRHAILAKVDWCSSNTLEVEIGVGEVRTIEVGSNMTGAARMMAMQHVVRHRPEEYLYLREV